MTKSEFEKFYGYPVTEAVYERMERFYNDSDDKDVESFVEQMKKEHVVDIIYYNMMNDMEHKIKWQSEVLNNIKQYAESMNTPELRQLRLKKDMTAFIFPSDILFMFIDDEEC